LKTLLDKELAKQVVQSDKKNFKLFDFFANCEYFETEFNYDEILMLPPKGEGNGGGEPPQPYQTYDSTNPDPLKTWVVKEIGVEGMKIDRMYFDRFEEKIKEDTAVQKMIEKRDLEAIEKYILQNIFEKPEDFYNLTKLQTASKVDRKLTLREIIEKMFGFIPYFKSKDELLEDEFEKFDSRYLPDEQIFSYAKNYFKSYITDNEFRDIIENKNFALLNTNPNGVVFRKLTPEMRYLIPKYIKENISINQFNA
jgi:type I restriction enzyme R subunit